jgi:hypothetical protein
MSEVRRTADSETKRIGGQARPEQEVLPEDGGAWGGWRRNVRKCMIMKSRRPVPVLEGAGQESEFP